jgi:hypothetical protein
VQQLAHAEIEAQSFLRANEAGLVFFKHVQPLNILIYETKRGVRREDFDNLML